MTKRLIQILSMIFAVLFIATAGIMIYNTNKVNVNAAFAFGDYWELERSHLDNALKVYKPKNEYDGWNPYGLKVVSGASDNSWFWNLSRNRIGQFSNGDPDLNGDTNNPLVFSVKHPRIVLGSYGQAPKTITNQRISFSMGKPYTDIGEYIPHFYTLDGEIAYCFDITTADTNTPSPFVYSNSLADAGIPTTYISEDTIYKIAIAAQVLSRNNFEYMRNNPYKWIRSEVYTCPGQPAGDVQLAWNYTNGTWFTLEDFAEEAAKCGELFYRSMVQYMIWDQMNGGIWSDTANWGDRFSNANVTGYKTGGSATGGSGTYVDKDGHVTTYTSGPTSPGIGLGAYIDFEEMMDEAYAHFFEDESYNEYDWEQQDTFYPGETKTYTNPEIVANLKTIYDKYGYIGSSSSGITFTYVNANKCTLTASTTAPSHSWYAWQSERSHTISVVSSRPYNAGSATTSSARGSGQFIVKVHDIKKIRYRVRVEQTNSYVKITKTVPIGYNAAGATFGLYHTEADANANVNKITTLTIGNNGQSSTYQYTLSGTSETLWAKELTPPTQTGNFTWIMDSDAKSVTITAENTENNPATFSFTNDIAVYGYGEVVKTAPTGYSPAGAQYTIYTDSACENEATAEIFANGTVQKFTIGNNGVSNLIQFNVPSTLNGSLTVYVKETKKPTQPEEGFTWQMDSNIYTMTIRQNNTDTNPVRVNSHNNVTERGYGKIIKRSNIESLQAYVDGAVFTVYYPNTTLVAHDLITNEPVILTIENGESPIFTLPVGTYIIKETTVPNGFAQAPDQTIEIHKDETTTITITNTYQYGYAKVIKSVGDIDTNDYPIAGTKFGIYTDSSCRTLARDVITGAECILTVRTDLTTNTVNLGLGTYYVKEISTTEWYVLNTTIKVLNITEADTLYTVEFENQLAVGIGKVEKHYGD